MANDTALVTDDPLPVKATFATVLSTDKVVTSTSPESVAVPPTLLKVKVVTPLIAPLAVMSVFATLFPIDNVNELEPPVTAPIVMSPVVSLAFVLIVVLAPSVTAPKLMASLELLISEAKVTVPFVVSVNPPLKVKASLEALPKLRVPVLSKVTALVKVPPPLKTKS